MELWPPLTVGNECVEGKGAEAEDCDELEEGGGDTMDEDAEDAEDDVAVEDEVLMRVSCVVGTAAGLGCAVASLAEAGGTTTLEDT